MSGKLKIIHISPIFKNKQSQLGYKEKLETSNIQTKLSVRYIKREDFIVIKEKPRKMCKNYMRKLWKTPEREKCRFE